MNRWIHLNALVFVTSEKQLIQNRLFLQLSFYIWSVWTTVNDMIKNNVHVLHQALIFHKKQEKIGFSMIWALQSVETSHIWATSIFVLYRSHRLFCRNVSCFWGSVLCVSSGKMTNVTVLIMQVLLLVMYILDFI